MAAFLVVNTVVTGAGSATLATAITNGNTAIASGITTALAVANMNPQSLKIIPNPLLWDSTLYIVSASIQYTTGG